MTTIKRIRSQFRNLLLEHPTGNANGTLELIGTSFIADEPAIFGTPNEGYIARELEWYASQSLNVHDIPGGPPKIWVAVANSHGEINSNYGALCWGRENGWQMQHVFQELRANPLSRRAVAIYTNPGMHTQALDRGKNDFVCTNAVNYFIRGGFLDAVVQMRSNDVVFGYRNDYAWQREAQSILATKLDCPVGTITWQAASLHVYARHFHLIEETYA